MNLVGVVAESLGEITNKRLQNLYQRDFIAWQADVLGFRTYDKMEEIANTALFGDIPRTVIKSSNGTSKSFTVTAMIGWSGSVFDVGEAISIISAPSLSQIEKVTFRYLKSFKARAAERGFILPGHINEQMEWKVQGPEGLIPLAYGKKPAPGQEVAVFQGVRSEYGLTFVWFDEAGGMAKGMYTAAEAVMTGAKARFTGIGNPDDAHGEFAQIYKDKKYDGEYNRFTISSFDLPTFTGEVVYPDDPEMERRMLDSLTQVEWVEHKKRIWGETDARYLSKVLGQFPKDGGNGFFPQSTIDMAHDTEIEEDSGAPLIIGADIARWGQDESVIAANRGGRIRVADSWGKCDLVDSARRIHKYAVDNGATEVRIDSTGVGGGVYDMLERLDEFQNGEYLLVGWDNGSGSPDISQWSNKRAYAHDSLRKQMSEGEIDLEYADDQLRNELQVVTYKFNNRGAIQITPKDELKTHLDGGSPDRLDAVIMAACDMSPWTGNPWNEYKPGAAVVQDREDLLMGLDELPMFGAGLPLL